jgi:hypothetical protein
MGFEYICTHCEWFALQTFEANIPGPLPALPVPAKFPMSMRLLSLKVALAAASDALPPDMHEPMEALDSFLTGVFRDVPPTEQTKAVQMLLDNPESWS